MSCPDFDALALSAAIHAKGPAACSGLMLPGSHRTAVWTPISPVVGNDPARNILSNGDWIWV
jgi:hypothetical protein